ncbi:YodC family protein [Sphingomonas sp. MMS24-J45]|uniref:YodC family protein n=1 Tax=Sphingomonas sp. MMS24-J45 TaxID=3238806 RepID=UPI00384CF053
MKIGDLVKLKSGGPFMTVSWMQEDDVGCNWFNQNDELKSAHFRENELRLVLSEEL